MSRGNDGRRAYDREILRLAIPAFGALVAEPLYVLADTAIVGHLGRSPLAGLGIAAAILSPAFAVFNFLAYGTTAAVARSRGAGDQQGAVKHGVAGMWLGAAIGIAIMIAGLGMSRVLVDAIAATHSVARPALTYLRISTLGAPFVMIAFAATGYLRGTEDTKTPLYIALGANVLNIMLEVLFIYGFTFGIAGSAWGTVLAQGAAAAVFISIVARSVRTSGASPRPHWRSIRATAIVGSQLMLRTGSLLIAFLTAAVIAARIGDVQIAAHQVCEQVWLFLAFALDSIAIAGQVIVGRELGAGDNQGTRIASRRMLQWGWWSGIGCAVLVLVCAHWLPGWFSNDRAVQHQIRDLLWIVAITQPFGGLVFVLDGILIGAGDAKYLARAMAAATGIFLVVAALILVFNGSLTTIWLGLFVFIGARLYGMLRRYRGTAWMVFGAAPTFPA